MKGRIVKIGHSRGIRLPKQILEETGLNGDVEIHVKENGIVIEPIATPRAGWADAARAIAAEGLLDDDFETEFDQDQWQW
jgi:antitoxin MazE